MEASLVNLYQFLAKRWNALLAGTSLLGVAVFSVIPPWQKYVPLFIFATANAIVWTLIEIKADLSSPAEKALVHRNMRTARRALIQDIDKRLGSTSRQHPLQVTMIGGRIRSMSDIVREISDTLSSGHVSGHISIRLFALAPDYIRTRILPGATAHEEQLRRNASYASIIENITREITALNARSYGISSFHAEVCHYHGDPHIYAYVIGDSVLYWGTFTWSDAVSDFVGPENPCYAHRSDEDIFPSLRSWILNRAALYSSDTPHQSGRVEVAQTQVPIQQSFEK